MFPDIYKKKKVIYDDFSKIYLTNLQQQKSSLERNILDNNGNDYINDNNNYLKKFSSLNNINNINNLNTNSNDNNNNLNYLNSRYHSQYNSTKNLTNNFGRETIKNSFIYSFKDKMQKKQQTLYNSSKILNKSKTCISPIAKTNIVCVEDLNKINDNIESITKYVSIS